MRKQTPAAVAQGGTDRADLCASRPLPVPLPRVSVTVSFEDFQSAGACPTQRREAAGGAQKSPGAYPAGDPSLGRGDSRLPGDPALSGSGRWLKIRRAVRSRSGLAAPQVIRTPPAGLKPRAG